MIATTATNRRRCMHCGVRLRADNRLGICQQTTECRRAYGRERERRRRRRAGIAARNVRRFTPAEDEAIRDGVDAGRSFQDIADQLGRSNSSVRKRAVRLGFYRPGERAHPPSGNRPQPIAERVVEAADAYCRAAESLERATDEVVIDAAFEWFGSAETELEQLVGPMHNPPTEDSLVVAAFDYVGVAHAQLTHDLHECAKRVPDPAAWAAAHQRLMRAWRAAP